MERTIINDKNGTAIHVGNQVLFKDELYNVEVNSFNGRLVIDNECGQEYLIDVHTECELVS